MICFVFQAEDCIRDVERARGLGDVYKRQQYFVNLGWAIYFANPVNRRPPKWSQKRFHVAKKCIGVVLMGGPLYTSDAADE